MTPLRRAILFGFLIWLIPFVVAFVIFPLRESSRPLFESIMPVSVAAATVIFGVLYFRHVTHDHVRQGILIGVTWLAMCLLIDIPLMLLGGPMQMTLWEYISDIGITYLMIPAITIGMGVALVEGGGRSEEGGVRSEE